MVLRKLIFQPNYAFTYVFAMFSIGRCLNPIYESPMPYISYNSPVGPISIFQEDDHIVAVDWGWTPSEEPTPLLEEARDQLLAYFNRTLTRFDLPFKPHGTPFQIKVWKALSDIPLGKVETYGALAAGLDTHPRPVGQALGRNPIPILIPCHRVIATGGGLGGYSGIDGIETKRFLLNLEGVKS